MGNIFVNIPVPAGNGSGAAVDMHAFGSSKTISVTGPFSAAVTIEISNELVPTTWAPLATFNNPDGDVFNVACRWMRASVAGYKSGLPACDVGGSESDTSFASLPAPAGNGTGAAIDVSALPLFKTVTVGGPFGGNVQLEVSEDGVTDWSQIGFGFNNPGQESRILAARFMRVVRSGVPQIAPGLPIVDVGACPPSGGGAADVAAPSIIVYAPGIVDAAPPYYNNWNDVEDAVNALDGACQLWVDQTGFSGYAPVPATANLDGQGRLEIIGKGPGGEAGLTFADGAQIKNVQTFRTIVLRGQASVTPPLLWDLDGMIIECYDATFLFAAVCAQPVMQISVPNYISFFFSHSSELRNGNNPGAPVMNINAPALCFLCIDTLFFPSSFDGKISGQVGSTLEIQVDSSLPPSFTLPGFLGALTFSNIDSNLGKAGGTIGFFGAPPIAKPTVTGSRGGNAALASLLTELANLGLIIDGTVP